MSGPEPVFELHEVAYSPPNGPEILAGVNLALAPGELVWISGPSGGGKSTLLRLMNRLLSPVSGNISFLGRSLEDWSFIELRSRAVLMPQTPVLLPGTVRENLLLPFGLKVWKDRARPGQSRLQTLLDRLLLTEIGLDQDVEGLSVGQAQRIALGRVLLMEPRALLLDEPVASLDEKSRRVVEELAFEFARDDGAVVMVSHLPPHNGDPRDFSLVDGMLHDGPYRHQD